MPESFLVYDQPRAGAATHAVVIGVGAYPHLNGGTGTLSSHHDGMGQLISPPISARMFASWLMTSSPNNGFAHATKPLGSVALLLSEAHPSPFVDPNDPARSFPVTEATFVNVEAALQSLFQRGDQNPDNLLIFYFCGHGIAAGTDTALLLSDYGKDPFNALKGAIDFRRLRLGMQRIKASEQCFFIDACRASTDSLIEAQGNAGQVVIGGGTRDPALPIRRAPVFYATMNGFKAYARTGEPTIFTEALLKALRDLAADDEMGDWRVSTSKIQPAVEHLAERNPLAVNKKQVPTADDISNIHLNFLAATPRALVYVRSNPPTSFDTASLMYRLAGSPPQDAPVAGRNGAEWALELPSGNYDFTVTFPAKPPRVVSNSVRPAFRIVTVQP